MFSRHGFATAIAAAVLALPLGVLAQTAEPAPKHKPKPYQSPLDTIMATHLWTDVPAARDFVKESRPAAGDLHYTPLTGKDPERPKPRDKANIEALQAELEQDGARNAVKARGLVEPAKGHGAKKAKTTK